MNSFSEKFKVEVGEFCERLESGLLQLEQNSDNQQIIAEIFRIMHTMKGSGGMFGFDLISDVTHDLESLFEIFRSGKKKVDLEVISFTLRSVDQIKELLVEDPEEGHYKIANALKAETQQQIARFSEKEPENKYDQVEEIGAEKASDENAATYFISFIPDENVLKDGTNPLYLIDELNALGECNIQVSLDKLPDLNAIDPAKCYVNWYLFIATTASVDTLNEVFLFVANKSEIVIEKIANKNIIHNEALLASYLNTRSNGLYWEIPEEPVEKVVNEPDVESLSPNTEPKAILKIEPEVGKKSAFGQTVVDSIRVDSVKIDRYMNLVSEFITAQSRLEQLASALKNPELNFVAETWAKLNRQLRDNAFEMSLIPLQSLEVRFKRLVFDLANALNKEIELVTEGLETELDKNIIENLTEPLLHLIRNSIDHGIETKEQRLAVKKNPVGRIKIKASTIGSYVQIEIEDDGEGLNAEKIRNKAIAKGFISQTGKLAEEELFHLIFEPGFSTSEELTDISGRGVGLDVVQKAVQNMRGVVEVESEAGKFTRFVIKLPLSLSIIDGLLTKVGSNYFVIPSAVVRKLYAVEQGQLKREFRQVVEFEGVQFPYLNLTEEFEPSRPLPDEQQLVAISYGNHIFGLIVDEIVREYQAVIKPLGRMLKAHDIFSGANILGSGDLALVIDTNKLIQKYS
jgi:Chemotaxis protein histidine kinase and related kinases